MLTQAYLKQALEYDQDTGVFTRLTRTSNRIKIGDTAGTKIPSGYIAISVGGRIHRAHRLAFLYMTGEWPEHDVDHINGERADNRWVNLRCATRQTNTENIRRALRNSVTGVLGVSPKQGKFVAQISHAGRVRHLGYFTTPEEAHQVYLNVKRELHAGCTI